MEIKNTKLKIQINSTSFLMQDTPYWSQLKKYDVRFNEYGNILLFSKKNENINFEITTIFFSDLIQDFTNNLNYKKNDVFPFVFFV